MFLASKRGQKFIRKHFFAKYVNWKMHSALQIFVFKTDILFVLFFSKLWQRYVNIDNANVALNLFR